MEACFEGKIELPVGTRIVEIGVLLQCLSTILLAIFSNPLCFVISAKRYDFHACFIFFALALLIENFVSIAG